MKVFVDANVLFSAAWKDGMLRQMILALARRGEACTNAHAVHEAERNLATQAPERVAALRSLLDELPRETGLAQIRELMRLPEKDRPILAGAVAGKCSHLVTGDQRDFGPMLGHAVQGVRIVTPRMLAEELAAAGKARHIFPPTSP